MVMKTLPRALADGDPIQAVVRGLGVASDGRGRSLWAPRKEGQMHAMRRAYQGDVSMADLQYVEAHATATQLGDATEIGAVCDVLKEHLPPGKKIPISSLKANIGHSLEAAGLAGLIKSVLCIQHRTIVPRGERAESQRQGRLGPCPALCALGARCMARASGGQTTPRGHQRLRHRRAETCTSSSTSLRRPRAKRGVPVWSGTVPVVLATYRAACARHGRMSRRRRPSGGAVAAGVGRPAPN